MQKLSCWLLLACLLLGFSAPASAALHQLPDQQSSTVSAYELIIAMNTLRVSNGLPALIEDPIINAVSRSTAEIMAANQMSWHIGDVRGRLAAAGYGGGAQVWATENFAVGNMSIDEIMVAWSDASHMIPAVNPAYCNVGAGVATSASGRTYYVLQAAYTSGKACGEYTSAGGSGTESGGGSGTSGGYVSQLIVPVKIAKPDKDGKIFHAVQAGQSFWAIAIAYQVTIRDLEIWNNISRDTKLQIGQKLFIPSSNTEGYATPTPLGMIQVSTPDSDGRIVHTVQAYQTLITIAQAYKISVDNILAMNGIQRDWPLQIDQKLIINPGFVTPTSTPRPLSPIEKLTPEGDGRYYHNVNSGETLSWIAGYYGINLNELMAWNSLNAASIIRPGQKLILQVTPPATETPTPEPATVTPTATNIPPTASPTNPPVATASPEFVPTNDGPGNSQPLLLFAILGVLVGGLSFGVWYTRRKS